MRALVLTHGHCFDGTASATLVTRLLTELEGSKLDFVYRGCGYGPNQTHPTPAGFTGDKNVLLDFRFCPSERLDWYFDHHKTAFRTQEDRQYFDEHGAQRHYFFDSGYGSCTKLIADTARARYGVDFSDLEPLVTWADKIDSAAFSSPEEAVDRKNPLLQLAAVIEHHGDDGLLRALVPELLQRSVLEVASSALVKERYGPLDAKYERFVQRVERLATRQGRVVFVDMTETVLETVGKFVTYALYPDCAYSVLVGRFRNGIKISVGYNPWSGSACDVDVSAICARYGGGGHAVVGGITFASAEVTRAIEVARSISRELNGEA